MEWVLDREMAGFYCYLYIDRPSRTMATIQTKMGHLIILSHYFHLKAEFLRLCFLRWQNDKENTPKIIAKRIDL
jgi:hypothetical protein